MNEVQDGSDKSKTKMSNYELKFQIGQSRTYLIKEKEC